LFSPPSTASGGADQTDDSAAALNFQSFIASCGERAVDRVCSMSPFNDGDATFRRRRP
jgi:hypothetical protein